MFINYKSFPNVNIAFRIYLSVFGTSSEGERSFSKLKLIKNYLRSTTGQTRLSSLATLSIENDLMREMSFEDVICECATAKSRKMNIIYRSLFHQTLVANETINTQQQQNTKIVKQKIQNKLTVKKY